MTSDLISNSDVARALAAAFAGRGFALINPPILQPAEIFIELSGEDIRRRLFLVSDPSGAELCLRPDFTIPVARLHLASGDSGERRYTYCGPTFRARRAEAGQQENEFQQAGIEIFGAQDVARAEMEVIELAIAGVRAEGLERFAMRLGDPGMFAALLDVLDLPDALKRRLRRHYWRHDLPEDLAAVRTANNGQVALATALAGLDRKAASDLISEVLSLAGINPVGGRTAEEIAARFMERADASAPALSAEKSEVIRSFLDIEGEPEDAFSRVAHLLIKVSQKLAPRLEALGKQLGLIRQRVAASGGADLTFDAEFGRRLEYYTGIVFEILHPDRPELGQIAGGGRYDRLLSDLGAPKPIPAVGCAIYVDRLLAATGGDQ